MSWQYITCPQVSIPVCIRFRLSRSKAFFKDGPIVVRPPAFRFFSSVAKVAWLSFHPACRQVWVACEYQNIMNATLQEQGLEKETSRKQMASSKDCSFLFITIVRCSYAFLPFTGFCVLYIFQMSFPVFFSMLLFAQLSLLMSICFFPDQIHECMTLSVIMHHMLAIYRLQSYYYYSSTFPYTFSMLDSSKTEQHHHLLCFYLCCSCHSCFLVLPLFFSALHHVFRLYNCFYQCNSILSLYTFLHQNPK